MRELLDRNRERLRPEERQRIWHRVRPTEAQAHRVVTARRWALSFGLATIVVGIAAIMITDHKRDRAARLERDDPARLPMAATIPPGPIAVDQLREVALSRSTDGIVYDQGPRPGAGPFVHTTNDSTSAFALVVRDDSYASAARYLEGGNLPPPRDVRIEEFINAFDQGYPEFDTPDLRLFVDGAPSPFGDRCHLIRVGLKARSPASPDSAEMVAEAAGVQVTFDPRSVAQYRLIGFEKSGIRRDAAAAGATIASGYEVAALYEIKLARNLKTGRLLEARVRYERPDPAARARGEGAAVASDAGTGAGTSGLTVEITASLGAEDLTPMFAMAPARFRLDAAVAEFGEILRGVPWAEGHSVREVLLMAEGLATEAPGSWDLLDFATIVRRAAEIREEIPRSETRS